MRMFEQPRFEALVHTAVGGAHYAGKQPNASIEQDHRAKLAARQDIVADADRLDRTRFTDVTRAAVRDFEPNVPWNEEFLTTRANCYATVGDPLGRGHA